MAIQWFPGHMHSTRKAIAERMKTGIDVVIELLDARLPGSSNNPLLADLTAGKPALKLLNKQDLADEAGTTRWLAHYNAQPETRAIGLDASERAPAAKLVAASRLLAPLRGGMAKPLRLLICGVPNVGKSTLINTLVGKKSVKTGDEAGITKVEQRISLAADAYLFDTPGMLWPRIRLPESGILLAASGAVGRNAYDEQEVALGLLERLQAGWAPQVEARYKLSGVAALPSDALLEAIARQRGLIQTGGKLNWQKAAEVVINDFRSGALGRV
ncbi:MAG: ribosome biogenesis GTPase YlqF, partial [Burkholderiales bacterium PBB5]